MQVVSKLDDFIFMISCKQEALREHLNMEECMVDIKDQKAQHFKVYNCPGKKNCSNSKLLSRYGSQMTTMMLRVNGQTGTLAR